MSASDRRSHRLACGLGLLFFCLLSFPTVALGQQAPPPAPRLAPAADEPAPGSAIAPADVAPPPPGAAADPADVLPPPEQAGQLLPEHCEGSNKAFWWGVAGMNAAALLLLFLVYALFSSRNWLSGIWRLLVVAIPFAAAAGVAVATVRPEHDIVAQCLAHPEMRSLISLNALVAWQQGLLLGALPVLGLAFVVKVVHRLFTR